MARQRRLELSTDWLTGGRICSVSRLCDLDLAAIGLSPTVPRGVTSASLPISIIEHPIRLNFQALQCHASACAKEPNSLRKASLPMYPRRPCTCNSFWNNSVGNCAGGRYDSLRREVTGDSDGCQIDPRCQSATAKNECD